MLQEKRWITRSESNQVNVIDIWPKGIKPNSVKHTYNNKIYYIWDGEFSPDNKVLAIKVDDFKRFFNFLPKKGSVQLIKLDMNISFYSINKRKAITNPINRFEIMDCE